MIHPAIEQLVEDLKGLQQASDSLAQQELAEKIRSKIFKFELNAHLKVLNHSELKKIFSKCLTQLSRHFPINDTDPISLIPLVEFPKSEIIELSSGHNFHLRTLIEFFNKNKQDVFSFENPYSREKLPLYDSLRIIEIAKNQDITIQYNPYSSESIFRTLQILDFFSKSHELTPSQFKKILALIIDVHQIFVEIRSKVLGFVYFYSLSYLLKNYLSFINDFEKPYTPSAIATPLFYLANGLPCLLLLKVKVYFKSSDQERHLYDNQQLYYFLFVLVTHFTLEQILYVLDEFQKIQNMHEIEALLHFFLVWMMIAQLSSPRASHRFQSYFDNFSIGVLSLAIEIYRHPNYSAKDFNHYFSSNYFIDLMFGISKTVTILNSILHIYTKPQSHQPSLFHRFNEIREFFDTHQEPISPSSMV
jgi:hypothetical protein